VNLGPALHWLAVASAAEGLQLALRVRRGELTRAEVEAAHRDYPGDVEPVVALAWLDRWGL
jgi:hypothetical protein